MFIINHNYLDCLEPFPSSMQESEKWKWNRSVVSDCSDPMDCSLPGSSVHGIFQAKVLEWGAIAFSDAVSLLKRDFSRKKPEKSLAHVALQTHCRHCDPVSSSGREEGQKRVQGVSPQVTERKLLIRGRLYYVIAFPSICLLLDVQFSHWFFDL